MSVLQHFSTTLENLRKEKGLTQKQLADELGVSRGTISFYEKAERTADIEFLVKAAEFFNVSVNYLLGKSKVRSVNTSVDDICEYTGLSEEAIEKLHLIVEYRDKDRSEYLWVTDEDFFDHKEFENQILRTISYIICNDRFRESIGNIVGYMDILRDRICAIDSLIEEINKKDRLDFTLIREIDSLFDMKHNKNIRLGYFEMIDSLKIAAEEYCEPLIKKREEVENELMKYWGESVLYKHLKDVSDEQAKEIRKQIMNTCLSITETVNQIAKKMGEINADNNQTE